MLLGELEKLLIRHKILLLDNRRRASENQGSKHLRLDL